MFARAFPWLPAAALLALPLALRPASAGSPALPGRGEDPPPATGAPQGHEAQPVAFIENRGQWDAAAAFAAQAGGVTLRAERDGFALAVLGGGDERGEGAVVRLAFEGARAGVALAGEDELPGTYNFLIGDDPARWRSGAKGYGSVLYRGLLDGVDVRLRSAGRTLAYDVLLAPGAELDRCVVRCAGLLGLALEPDGALAMETSVGTLRQSAPVAWQELASGERAPVAARFRVLGPDRYGFEAPGRDPALPLVVDPGLLYSAKFGGLSGVDIALAVATDPSGLTTAAGYTDSFDFPSQPGSFDASHNGFVDVFVARLAPDGGSLQYSTFLGGTGDDRANALALDASGAATLAGYTTSPTFPTTAGSYDATHNGSADAFVARLSPSGASLDFSTFVGASGAERAQGLALEPSGAVTLVGWTQSPTFPVQSAFDPTFNGGTDAFAARLAPGGGSLSWSTFLGGALGTTFSNQDAAYAVAVDASGGAIVAGETNSFDFPGGGPTVSFDAFLVRLVPTGDSLSLALVFGGTSVEVARAVAVGADGAAVFVGATLSADFPTTAGAFDTTLAGGADAFAAKVALSDGQLLYATFLGGNGGDDAHGVALDPAGAATVAGESGSTDMPTTAGAFDTTFNGAPDAFVTRLAPDGASLVYSTYVGGGVAFAVALDAAGAASIAGQAASSFPTTPGALGAGSGSGAFVARLDLLPTGVSAFGASTPGCTGPLAIGVNSLPKVGHAGFALTCNNAPPAAAGVLLLTSSGLASPLALLGVDLWLDPSGPLFNPLAALADLHGSAVQPVPIPSNPAMAGASVSAQFAWFGPATPPPCPPFGVSASNALKIVVQP